MPLDVTFTGAYAHSAFTGYRGMPLGALPRLRPSYIHTQAKIFDESLVQVASGQLVRLPEMTARFAVGDKGDVCGLCSKFPLLGSREDQDILPAPGGIFSIFMPRPSNDDTVVAVSHTVLAVAWLAINQSVRIFLVIPRGPT